MRDFNVDLVQENEFMVKELHKNKEKEAQNGDAKGELKHLREGITNYMSDIEGLQDDV